MEHNPDGLTPEQVGISEGCRLLDEDEVSANFTALRVPVALWQKKDSRWDEGGKPLDSYFGNNLGETYRTKLSRAELRAARNLPPEVTEESEESESKFYDKTLEYWKEMYSLGEDLARRAEAERDAALAEVPKLKKLLADSNRGAECNAHVNRRLAQKLNAALAEVQELKRERDEARVELANHKGNDLQKLRLYRELSAAQAALKAKDMALKLISEWEHHPCEWTDERKRDHYRRIASDALAIQPNDQEEGA